MVTANLVYAEDLVLGEPYEMGSYHLTTESVIRFAQEWDPQDFHVDEDAAATHGFGGLIASGLQTVCICQRLAVGSIYQSWAVIAGKTVRDMSFLRPVRPGMTLTGSITITDIVPRDEKRSLVFKHAQLWEVGGDPVFTMKTEAYMRRRPA